MINTGPDFPFNGSLETPADPGTTGQVMQFIVNTSLTQTSDSKTTTPQNLVLPAERPLGAATYTRRLSLNEEESNQLCVQTLPDGSIVTLFNRPKDADFAKDCAAAGGSPMAPKRALFGVMAKDSSGDLVSMPLRWMDLLPRHHCLTVPKFGNCLTPPPMPIPSTCTWCDSMS